MEHRGEQQGRELPHGDHRPPCVPAGPLIQRRSCLGLKQLRSLGQALKGLRLKISATTPVKWGNEMRQGRPPLFALVAGLPKPASGQDRVCGIGLLYPTGEGVTSVAATTVPE